MCFFFAGCSARLFGCEANSVVARHPLIGFLFELLGAHRATTFFLAIYATTSSERGNYCFERGLRLGLLDTTDPHRCVKYKLS
jgi:hypothetical protein